MRLREFFGVQAQSAPGAPLRPVEAYLTPRPVWPDVDQRYSTVGGTLVKASGTYADRGDKKVPGLRAVCLAPDTDWDHILVGFDGQSEMFELGPGKVIYAPSEKGADQLRVAPPCRVPSTRLYNASGLRKYATGGVDMAADPRTAAVAGGNWDIQNDDTKIINRSGGNWQTYVWNGSAWVAGDIIGNDAWLTTGGGGTIIPPDGHAANRPSDVSPDGVYSFAEYIAMGLIVHHNGTPFGRAALANSQHIVSGDAQKGDNSTVTWTPFVSQFDDAVTTLVYGRLALELWIDECPPVTYRPTLPAERVITFGELAVAANAAADTDAHRPVVTVPTLNVDEVQYTYRIPVGSPNVFAQIGSPLPDESPDDECAVKSTPAATAVAGNGAAAFRGENVHSFAQLLVGSTNGGGGGTVLAGSQLVMRRRFIG